MILWTSQEEAVCNELLKTGVYRCDLNLSPMRDYRKQYDWLVRQMKQRIGPPPEQVTYPVWALYQQDGKHRKPDLRRERWAVGCNGERFACLEIEIPDREVLLSDLDVWCIILNDGLLSDTEQEDRCLEAQYEALSPSEKRRMKEKNWERGLNRFVRFASFAPPPNSIHRPQTRPRQNKRTEKHDFAFLSFLSYNKLPLRQNLKPVAVRIFDEVDAHRLIFKADAAHLLVLFVRRVKIVRPKCEVEFALAEVIRLRMILQPSEF